MYTEMITCPDCKQEFDKWSDNWHDLFEVCKTCADSYLECGLCREKFEKFSGYSIDDKGYMYDVCSDCVKSGRENIAFCDVCKEYQFLDFAKDYYKSNPNDYKVCPKCDTEVVSCDVCHTDITINYSGYDTRILCKTCYQTTVLAFQYALPI